MAYELLPDDAPKAGGYTLLPDEPAPVQRRSASPLRDLLAGGVRGAASIGTTILKPTDYIEDWLNNRPAGETNKERAKAIEQFMREHADPQSLAFGVGKLGAEIAGTAGAGGVLGAGAKALGASGPIVNALSSAGFTTGRQAAPGIAGFAADMGLRAAAGGVNGAVTAGMIDPSSAGTGAAIGAALPVGVRVAGSIGGAIGKAFRSAKGEGGDALSAALNADTLARRRLIAEQLRQAETLVPGSSPTVAQVLQTPEASILQRVVYDSPGGGALREKIVQQANARLAALERVAPTNVNGFQSAQADTGRTIGAYARGAEKAATGKVTEMFDEVRNAPGIQMQLPVDEMRAAAEPYVGAGSFGGGGKVKEALKKAEEIGQIDLSAVKAASAGRDETLLSAVKRAGGINLSSGSSRDFAGELRDLSQSDLGRFAFKNRGKSLENMAEHLYERGLLPDDDPVTLINALRENPRAVTSAGTFQAQAERAMGDAPLAGVVPRNVPFDELQRYRSSLGDAARSASMSGDKTEAAALYAMRSEVDDAVNRVVRGDDLPGENFPLAMADKWTEALKAHAEKKLRFNTGPQAAIFRPNNPAQGGEIAALFWGNRPGLAEDVQDFRKLVADNPKMLGQFRGMVATQGAGTADASGNLTTKFSKWVKQTLPGLQKAFDPKEVATLQKIAADIDRAAAAQKLGTSLGGSNTYQNAANALNLGVLDSPIVSRAAGMIPGVRLVAAPALDGVRGFARNVRARQLAGLLSDPNAAADALMATRLTNPPEFGLLGPMIGRSVPLLAAQ